MTNTNTTPDRAATPLWTLKRVQEYLDERALQDAYTECILLANEIVTEYERELAAARAQVAYEPLPYGQYADGAINYDEDGLLTVYGIGGSNWIVFELPDDICLMRRIQGAQEAGDE